MRTNSLKFMIRGHDQPLDGYRYYFDNRCITITSALNKNSTIILIDSENEELRMIKVATVTSSTISSSTTTKTKEEQFE